jgi:4-diphosphocytidyl-2-C-methyl-D-erythritol kinase
VTGRVWLAPAKLNLFLHITGRRPDGYHELQTVFQFLDFCDELRVQVRPDAAIRLMNPVPGVAPESDLVVQAARLLQRETGASMGANIEVLKHVPMGGGLGGGSSDAATTLVALNHHWELGLSREVLGKLGLRLGADVPIFVRGAAAWGEGVGEQLTAVYPDQPWYLVVHPGCHVSTAAVFSAAELTRHSVRLTIPARLKAPTPESGRAAVTDLMADTRNDCEPVVFQRYPAVEQVCRWLSRYGPARMTGTGASVFAPFSREEDARRVLHSVPGDWAGFVARGRNRSPLYAD